jgi:hypothetical protein
VNAIGPDHHVKVAWRCPVEGHVDTTVGRWIWVIITSKLRDVLLEA